MNDNSFEYQRYSEIKENSKNKRKPKRKASSFNLIATKGSEKQIVISEKKYGMCSKIMKEKRKFSEFYGYTFKIVPNFEQTKKMLKRLIEIYNINDSHNKWESIDNWMSVVLYI